jgi:hypothetical protein
MARSVALAALLALVAALVWGCSHPTDHEIPPDLPYPLRSSPDSLMAQFVWAYENMDLGVYLDCFADSMVFYLSETDVQEHPELEPGYWRKAVEETIHGRMFTDDAMRADSIHLALTTTAVDTVSVPDGRGRGTGWKYTEAVDLRLYIGGEWMYWARSPSVFVIRQDPDDTGPGGETLYEIWEWRELDDSQDGTGREHRTWGAIKAMYRYR